MVASPNSKVNPNGAVRLLVYRNLTAKTVSTMSQRRTMLTRRRRKIGRPSLGVAARTRTVTLKLSSTELAAVRAAVRKRGGPTTVSSWFREHGLAPLGLSDLAKKRRRRGTR
jgi:hypothetical protein